MPLTDSTTGFREGLFVQVVRCENSHMAFLCSNQGQPPSPHVGASVSRVWTSFPTVWASFPAFGTLLGLRPLSWVTQKKTGFMTGQLCFKFLQFVMKYLMVGFSEFKTSLAFLFFSLWIKHIKLEWTDPFGAYSYNH